MDSDQGPVWRPKPGDKIIRRPRVKAHPLRRVLGIPGLIVPGMQCRFLIYMLSAI
jgi:hypothetical protein